MNIGEKIQELRKKNTMTQEQLAELLRVSPQAISKWERGVANPDLYLIPVIAETFNVSSDHLLGIAELDTESRLERIEKQLEAMVATERKPSGEAKPRENRKSRRKFIFLPKPPVGSHEGCRQEERSGPSPVIGRLGD